MNKSPSHVADPGLLSPGRAMAAAGLAAAATLFLPGRARAVDPPLTFNDIPGAGDVKVLNYALALEDLEADLYSQALKRLRHGGQNALGTDIPGLNLPDRDDDVFFVRRFGLVEAQHRDFLRGALGGSAISPFKYDFGMEKRTRQQVVELVFTAEKTGVGAYLGAIPFFATATYLQTAGAIQGTEARHTTVFAEILNKHFSTSLAVAPGPLDNNGIDQPLKPDDVLAAVSPFIVT